MATNSTITKFELGKPSLDLNKVGPRLRKLLTEKVTIPALNLVPLK